jgi:hypothetical protein
MNPGAIMRIPHVLAFIGAATLSMAAFADPSIAPSLSTGNSAQAQVQPSMAYRLTKDDADRMRGTFGLADGRTIKITSRLNKLFVDLDGKREELVPVGPNRFVTRDTGARLTFNQVPYPEEVVVNQAAR